MSWIKRLGLIDADVFFLGFLGPWGQPVDKTPKMHVKCSFFIFKFRTAKFRIGTWCLQTFRIFKIAKETGGDKKNAFMKKRNAPRILFERSRASALWTIACWELSLRCWANLGSQGAVVWAKYTVFPRFIWGSFVFFSEFGRRNLCKMPGIWMEPFFLGMLGDVNCKGCWQLIEFGDRITLQSVKWFQGSHMGRSMIVPILITFFGWTFFSETSWHLETPWGDLKGPGFSDTARVSSAAYRSPTRRCKPTLPQSVKWCVYSGTTVGPAPENLWHCMIVLWDRNV